jgi:hypothetical protein
VPSVSFSDYDLVTGAILYSAVCYGREPLIIPGTGRVSGKRDTQTNWVNPETKRFNKRKSFNVNVAREGNVITVSALPVGAVVWFEGERFNVDDGVFELILDQPIDARVSLKHTQFLDMEINA